MFWRKKKEDYMEEQPTEGILPKFARLPWYLKIFIIIAIILGLNIALFLPLGITSLLFELWILFISSLKWGIPFWLVLLLMAVMLIKGIYLIPRIEIPYAGIKALYIRHYVLEGEDLFYTLSPYGIIRTPSACTVRLGLWRYTVIGKTTAKYDPERHETKVESMNMELTVNEQLRRENIMLKRLLKKIMKDIEKGAVSLKKEEILRDEGLENIQDL